MSVSGKVEVNRLEFKYRAIDKKAKKTKGTIEVESFGEVKEKLKEEGLRLISVKVKKDSPLKKKWAEWEDQFSKLLGGVKEKREKKKQFESFKDELDVMGKEEAEKARILRGLNAERFDLDRFIDELSLSDIQVNKIRSGKIKKRREPKEETGLRKWMSFLPSFRSKVSDAELVSFTDQLALLLDNGIPKVKALQTIQKNIKSEALKEAVDEIIYDLMKGKPFSEALESKKDLFSNLYVYMVKTGEESDLSVSLRDLTRFLKMSSRIKRELRKGSVYPAMVFGLMVVVMLAFSYFLIPRFKEVFSEMEIDLPLLTEIVFFLSDQILWFVGLLGIVVFSTIVVFQKIPYTRDKGKKLLDRMVYKIPVIKKSTEYMQMYQASLILTITLKNGLSLTDSLGLLHNVVGNHYLKEDISTIIYHLEKGKDTGDTFEASTYFTNVFKSSIEAGDTSGKLPETLSKLADDYEEKLDDQMEVVKGMISPTLITAMVVLIGPFMIGMLLPMATLTDQLGNMM